MMVGRVWDHTKQSPWSKDLESHVRCGEGGMVLQGVITLNEPVLALENW